MYSAILKFFKKLGIPFCPRCDHPTLRADMCVSCAKEDDLAWDQFNALLEDDWVAQRGAEEAARHLLVDFEAYHLNQEDFLDDPDDEEDFPEFDNDDICPGNCNQPAYSCSCAETEALRMHNANPETRGSWFVA